MTIRIGFITKYPVISSQQVSGIPKAIWDALSRADVELKLLSANPYSLYFKDAFMESRAIGRFKRAGLIKQVSDRKLERSRNNLTEWINRCADSLDVLFTVYGTDYVFDLQTDIPLVLCSDTTPQLQERGGIEQDFKTAEYRERCALSKASALVYPARAAIRSAMRNWRDC